MRIICPYLPLWKSSFFALKKYNIICVWTHTYHALLSNSALFISPLLWYLALFRTKLLNKDFQGQGIVLIRNLYDALIAYWSFTQGNVDHVTFDFDNDQREEFRKFVTMWVFYWKGFFLTMLQEKKVCLCRVKIMINNL